MMIFLMEKPRASIWLQQNGLFCSLCKIHKIPLKTLNRKGELNTSRLHPHNVPVIIHID